MTSIERLCQCTPANFNILEAKPKGPNQAERDRVCQYHLVRDNFENAATYEEFLYCYLDIDIIQLIALWWFFVDVLTGKPMIAVAVVYLGEKVLKYIRADLG